jgi:adenine-specific DNA-methyltransferase
MIMSQAFVNQPMLTCIGNKRKLVPHICRIVERVRTALDKPKLRILDAFAGSTVVSRAFSAYAERLWVNDMELYSAIMARCFLVPPTSEQEAEIRGHIEAMNELARRAHAEPGDARAGIVTRLYAPQDTRAVRAGERCFYTRENAAVIDALREYVATRVPPEIAEYCLAPLLVRASIHANTSGVFKGFYKKEGIGHFGGAGENALSRIMRPIEVFMPIWNREAPAAMVTQRDAVALLEEFTETLDFVYLDPPYNQHPYGSNYFMLNVIAKNEEPAAISAVSGIPCDWQKSEFNYREEAIRAMRRLLEAATARARYVLLSYNNEGIIPLADLERIMRAYTVEKHEIEYDTFKGSRNLAERTKKVVEVMYLISHA